MTTQSYTAQSLSTWQQEKRLASQDRIWILTDIYHWQSSYYSYSTVQERFRVGAVDLRTNCLGEFWFTIDDAHAMLKAGVPAPPWTAPSFFGIEACRGAHNGTEKGRYHVTMTPIDLPHDLVTLGAYLRRQFRTHATRVNSTPGMWQRLVESVALVKKIEEVALAMTVTFSAGDIRSLVGKDVDVTPVLTRLVKSGRLHRMGEKKGTRYAVAPKKTEWWMIERDD
jgi:hypothetical protein